MKKILLYLIIGLILIGGGAALFVYQKYIVGANVPEDLEVEYINIPTNSSFDEVVALLEEKSIIKDETSFRWFAEYMKYKKDPMRAGRFKIQPSWSNIQLIRHLRNGQQEPVKVVLNNERLIEEVAAKVARFIEPDSMDMITLLQNQDYLQKIGYTDETLMSLFIPNTYEFYWNTTPEVFMERMLKEHNSFWSKDNRLQKAETKGMNPQEVYTLASIVERETQQSTEKPRMAGVYVNRLNTGMLLQADPTCVFARRDFGARRVTDYHTKFDSPYNTYMYPGLPPGPISMASIASIDAVLNAEDHKYVYFCAKGDGSGLHNFAKTLSAHNQNARIYVQNLRKRGLR